MKIVITDHGFKNIDQERAIFALAGADLAVAQCKTPGQVIATAGDADALLVQWASVNAEVIAQLTRCKVIVRYGIGVDNVDIGAAKARGIPVCNVPDYCIDEVADHSVSLALALARQVSQLDRRVRSGTWQLLPITPMPAFREMVFATAGFGRIARAVLERARGLKFKLAAYDPYVAPEQFEKEGVAPFTLDELFARSDVLSLHSPLTAESRHMVNATRLAQMKSTAILVNTARGALVDTAALAEALNRGTIAYAGLDVFEAEPLPENHPLRACGNALLTSHVAWYSEASVPQLQRMAAEEVVRGLNGKPLKNQVNK